MKSKEFESKKNSYTIIEIEARINETDKHQKMNEYGDCQGFLKKYYQRNEGGDFFKNPEGLTLTTPDEELSFLSV